MQKRKAVFNVIDVLIILIVLAAGVLAYFIFFRSSGGSNEEKEISKVRYVLQINELPAEYADNIKVDENVIDYGTHTSAGKVVAVDFENYVYVGHDKTTGEQRLTVMEDYVNLYVTVEGDASVINELYHVNDTSVYVGKRLDMMMPNLFCTGYCISVDAAE